MPPRRPAIPSLDGNSSSVPPIKVVDGLETSRYVGAELPGEQILVYTIHDGRAMPGDVVLGSGSALLEDPAVASAYRTERDWGANLVARHLSRHLGLGGFVKVELARALLDYGRLPGCSEPGMPHLKRRAIFAPVSGLLSHGSKEALLSRYDQLEEDMTRRFVGKRLTLAVHTYDPTDSGGEPRPELSLITGPEQRRERAVMQSVPYGSLFPAELHETCDRNLTRRMVRRLESAGREVSVNQPYEMHEGSVELRAQARLFYIYLRGRFEEMFPETSGRSAFQRVWAMLLDVSGRSREAGALLGFLRRSGAAPAGLEWDFAEARQAHCEIQRFLAGNWQPLLREYRCSGERPLSLAVEVRKDLLCELDRDGSVIGLRLDGDSNAREIARQLAGAIAEYVREPLTATGAPSVRTMPARASRVG
ncbi:MAG: hypothetical protein GY719_05005 [bacterium]|nr:hypothetical protein [bacterium]